MDDGGFARREQRAATATEQPVHVTCTGSWPNACTDEEFGGYYASVEDAMRAARKHLHGTQILPVSIEEYQEWRAAQEGGRDDDRDFSAPYEP